MQSFLAAGFDLLRNESRSSDTPVCKRGYGHRYRPPRFFAKLHQLSYMSLQITHHMVIFSALCVSDILPRSPFCYLQGCCCLPLLRKRCMWWMTYRTIGSYLTGVSTAPLLLRRIPVPRPFTSSLMPPGTRAIMFR